MAAVTSSSVDNPLFIAINAYKPEENGHWRWHVNDPRHDTFLIRLEFPGDNLTLTFSHVGHVRITSSTLLAATKLT